MADTADRTSTNSQPQVDRMTPAGQVTPAGRADPKALLVKPVTHELVREVAERLGRTTDAVVRAGVRLLNEKTAAERVLKDDDWANSIGGGS